MKIFVCVKQVPDTETKLKVNADHSGIDEADIKWVVNPYDEFAIEEALKLKAQLADDSTITLVSLGPQKRIVDALRTGLAMGADQAVAIHSEHPLDSFTTAKALAQTIQNEGGADLIFTGKLAIDDNAASVPQQIAEFLNIAHTTAVSQFENENGSFVVHREVEGGTQEVVQLQAPAVIGANKGLNTPRYATLPGIMKAKKKPLKNVDLSDLDVSVSDQKVQFTEYQLPKEKPPVKMIEGESEEQAQKLVQLLREEAKVL